MDRGIIQSTYLDSVTAFRRASRFFLGFIVNQSDWIILIKDMKNTIVPDLPPRTK